MSARVIPNSLFCSIFKNISGRDLWVCFVPPWGRTIKAGALFHVPGDPRFANDANSWPRYSSVVRKLMLKGLIEFVSSPSPLIDNQSADGQSLVLAGFGETLTPIRTPITEEAAGARTLPNITPDVDYDDAAEQFSIEWSQTTGILPTDTFTVKVTLPNGQIENVSTYTDRSFTYNASAGPGTYTFTVTLTAVDNRTQTGTSVAADTQ